MQRGTPYGENGKTADNLPQPALLHSATYRGGTSKEDMTTPVQTLWRKYGILRQALYKVG